MIECLIVALKEEDRAQFLPPALLEHLPKLCRRIVEFDPSRQDAAHFPSTLAETKAEVILTGWGSPPLPTNHTDSVKYLCHVCGTVRSIVSRARIENGLLVTNWGSSISRTVAEAALYLILACLRRATQQVVTLHQHGGWEVDDPPLSLFERRIGIHGFGNVARSLVTLLRPFECRLFVHAPDVDAKAERTYGVRAASTLDALFAENEIVVELAPLNKQTAGTITETLLRRLPTGGVFINVGRGAVVDETALIRVAREGRIHFGLDTFLEEPLARNHPLRGLKNVFLTPHSAGPTVDRRIDAGHFALRNLEAYAEGKPLEGVVTPSIYDQMT